MSTILGTARTAAWALTCAGLLSACADDARERPVGHTEREVIGGVAASSAKLNAIGALGYGVDGVYTSYCSATLIAPRAVLTAEHCLDAIYEGDQFLIGPDARHPVRTVPIVGKAAESTVVGGGLGLGSDVAIVHLGEDVIDVPLPTYGGIGEEHLGKKFIVAGYGMQDNLGTSDTRRVGTVTLRGLGGFHMQNLFATFEAFVADAASAMPSASEATLRYLWDDFPVLAGYEASFGFAEGDAQECYGDSGGPLLHNVDGKLRVVGVVSWGTGSERLVCDWGGVNAVLGPASRDFVAREVACPLLPAAGTCKDLTTTLRCASEGEGHYRPLATDCAQLGLICGQENGQVACVPDPCEGIPSEGMCDGTNALRCSTADEGARRKLGTDCSLLGLACGIENGQVACVDEAVPVAPVPVMPGPAPIELPDVTPVPGDTVPDLGDLIPAPGEGSECGPLIPPALCDPL